MWTPNVRLLMLTLGPLLVVSMVLSNLKTSTELNKMASIERDSKFTRRPWASLTHRKYRPTQCSNCRGVGWLNSPYLILPTPLPLVQIRPRGVEFQPPHLSFAEVGMLLDSHVLPMQFLKYLQCDDLNVTTILIHIEDYGLFSPGLSVKFY